MRRAAVLSSLVLVAALAVVAPTPARAGVEMVLDAEALTELLTIVGPSKVAVGMAPGATVEIQLEDMKVTGFDPKGNAGLGHLLTQVRLRAPEIGLDVRVTPRVALELRKNEGLSFCYVRFEDVKIPMPWGTLDAGPLLPAVPVRADHVFEVVTSEGTGGLRSKLVNATMNATSLRLTFDLEAAAADEPAGSDQ
jgi:hypothetical protein